MAKITGSILGNVSGKIGNVTFTNWKDIRVIKASGRSSGKTPTDEQKLVQEKFKAMSRLGKAFFPIAKIGLSSVARMQSEQNMFMSLNFLALSGNLGSVVVNYPSIIASRGNLEALGGLASASSSGSINFTWVYQNDGNGIDHAVLIAYNPEDNVLVFKQDSLRSAQAGTLAAPASWMGKEIHAYAFTISASRKVSNSQYAGKVTVA